MRLGVDKYLIKTATLRPLTGTGGGTCTVMSSVSTGESNHSLSSDDWLSEQPFLLLGCDR